MLIDIMTASEEVRRQRADYLWLVTLAPVLGVFAFAYDGIYIGATWAREMRNLMVLSLLIFLAPGWRCDSGNAGLGAAAGALRRARRIAGARYSGDASANRSDRQ
jgi:MATE family multidrug resistance protein